MRQEQVQQIRDAHSTRILGVDQPAKAEGAVAIIDFESHPSSGLPNERSRLDHLHRRIKLP
jgi:hypothetical protein